MPSPCPTRRIPWCWSTFSAHESTTRTYCCTKKAWRTATSASYPEPPGRLSSSTSYNANGLLDFFDDPEVSKAALIEILRVHKGDLSVHELLRHAYECEPKEKAAIFKIIQETIKPEMIPDLIARMGGKDPVIKIHLMQLLSKFDKAEITHALEMQLGDPNKMVRGAALSALATRDNSRISIEKVANMLTDPDLDVQGKAVDVLIKMNHPDTVRYLMPP